MSIDKSLKKKGAMGRARNVLKRHERIEKLKELEKWVDGASPFNLPKVRVFRLIQKKVKKEKKAEEGADAKGKDAKKK